MDDLCSPMHCNVCLVLTTDVFQEQEMKVALRNFKKLFICASCRLVRYCSVDHQKIDWPLHSSFCQAVAKLRQSHGAVEHPLQIVKQYDQGPKNRKELEEITLAVRYNLQKLLERPLKRHENDLVSFPAVCGVCFKWQKFHVICKYCQLQTYCGKDHYKADMNQHKAICHLLSLYYCPYKVLEALDDKSIQHFNSNKVDMSQYELKEFIEYMFSVKISLKPFIDPKDYQVFSFVSQFSCIASICYCLQYIPKIAKLVSKTFKLYIVGATVEAFLWFLEIHTKLFFLQQPEYESLELYFIGPELQGNTNEQEFKYQLNGTTCTVKYYYYCQYFENYVEKWKIDPRSSLIVAFNCGFSEYASEKHLLAQDTWSKALNEMLKLSNIPIMFTSFTQLEAEHDYAIVQSHISEARNLINRLHIVKNPYGELRPLRNWCLSDEEQFYYRNGYIQCIEVCDIEK